MTCPFFKNHDNHSMPNVSGCPFNQNRQINNPPLNDLIPSYNIDYISDYEGLFDVSLKKLYPYILIHTLFHSNREYIGKVRSREIAERYIVWSEIKDDANENYKKGCYYEALRLNEEALSCLKWLDIKPNSIELLEKEEKIEENDDPSINKYLRIYKAEDVMIKEEEFLDPKDTELRDSMLLASYLNISACYMKLSHYESSFEILKEAEKITQTSSQVLFRKAQTLSYNKENPSSQLRKAKRLIGDAIEIIKKEAIFQDKYKNLLKRLELDKAEEIYKKEAIYIDQRLLEVLEEEKKAMNFACEKNNTILEENCNLEYVLPNLEEEDELMEDELISEMIKKTRRIMQFYIETADYKEINIVKIQYFNLKSIQFNMNIYEKMIKDKETLEEIKKISKEYRIEVDEEFNKNIKRHCNFLKKKIFHENRYQKEVFKPVLAEYIAQRIELSSQVELTNHQNKSKNTKFSYIFPLFFFILFMLFLIYSSQKLFC